MTKKELIIFNLPNSITIARIFLVPVIVWTMLIDEFFISFILFSIAGISDFVDGWLARLQKTQTTMGAYLDPVADKLLMASAYLTLGLLGHIPFWLVILVISRDIFILVGIAITRIKQQNIHISPLMISKINTLIQICLIILVLADLGFVLGLDIARDLFYILAAITTVISAFAYLYLWVTTMAKQSSNR